MNRTKMVSLFLALALVTLSFGGCGDSTAGTSGNDTPAVQQSENGKPVQEERGTMARVVSMEGDTLTVILADQPAKAADRATPPAAKTQPASGTTPPAAEPSGNGQPDDRTPPEGTQPAGMPPEGAAPPQGMQGGAQIEFTGEEKTYTLSDNLMVTRGMGDSKTEIDLSEIQADDVISFTTKTDDDGNESIVTIRVME